MANDFDPDAFLAGDDFDPDAFLAEEPKNKSGFDTAMDVLSYGGRVGKTALAAPFSEDYSLSDVIDQASVLDASGIKKKVPSGKELNKIIGDAVQLPVLGKNPNYKGPMSVGLDDAMMGNERNQFKQLDDGRMIEDDGIRAAAGAVTELGADATNLIPFGGIVKGASKGIKGTGSLLRKGAVNAASKVGSKVDDVLLGSAKVIDKVAGGAGEIDDLDMLQMAYEGGRAKDVNAIKEASKRLGVKPTAGMLSQSPIVQGLESSLEQSPSIAGSMVRKEVGNVRGGIQKALTPFVEQGSELSKIETGDAFKRGVIESIAQRHAPLAAKFDTLRASTRFIDIPDKSKLAVANNIMNINAVKLAPNEPFAQMASRYSDYVLNAKTADDIKNIRGIVGKQLADAEGVDKHVLGEIYKKLSGLEERTIKGAAVAQARTSTEGAKIGSKMLSELKEAKKGYRELMESIGETADAAGLKRVETVENFLDAVEKMPSEQVADKVFKMNDLRSLEVIEKAFPTEFGMLRRQRISDIIEKSSTKGMLDPGKLVKSIKDYDPQTLKKVFGGDINQVLQDIKTVMDSSPNMIGPSGTPQGNMFLEMMRPFFQLQEAGRYSLYKRLKNPVKPIADVKQAQSLIRAAPVVKEAATDASGYSLKQYGKDLASEQKYKSTVNLLTQWEKTKDKPVSQEDAAQMYLNQGNSK
jgi:hypothetical protein